MRAHLYAADDLVGLEVDDDEVRRADRDVSSPGVEGDVMGRAAEPDGGFQPALLNVDDVDP
jgi:hypothetical protein